MYLQQIHNTYDEIIEGIYMYIKDIYMYIYIPPTNSQYVK